MSSEEKPKIPPTCGTITELINKGIELDDLGKFDDAIEKYKQANELNPENPEVLINWGLALLHSGKNEQTTTSIEGFIGKYEMAKEKFCRAHELKPNDPNTLMYWGIVLYNLGKTEEALEKYKKANELNPDNPEITKHFSLALNNLGKYKVAKENFVHSDKSRSNDPNTFMNLQVALENLGKNDGAIKQYSINYPDGNIMLSPETNEKLKSLIYERDVTDEEKLNTIRQYISEWAKSIPYHDLNDFGDKINILLLCERPSYKIKVQTLYEKRELTEEHRPFVGKQIPPKIIDKNNVDIWSYGYNIQIDEDDFKEKADSGFIAESQEVHECFYCRGKGEDRCYNCGGSTRERCSRCSGTGEVRCSSCGGSGKHECRYCGGSGQREQYFYDRRSSSGSTRLAHCNHCGGGGSIPCTYCKNGYQNCDNCGGRAEVDCHVCDGSGILICSDCKGYGSLVSYLNINSIFKPKENNDFIHHKMLPNPIISGNQLSIYNGGDIISSEGISFEDPEEILNIILKEIAPNILEPVPNENLRQILGQLLLNLKDNSEMGIINKDYIIFKQKLAISQICAIYLKYIYNQKDYDLWIYGKENNIFAPENPILEACQEHFLLAQNYFSSKDYSQSLDEINKVICMNPLKEDAKTLKNKIIHKIGIPYFIGGLAGAISIGGSLGTFLSTIMLHISMGKAAIYSYLINIIISIVVGYLFYFKISVKIRDIMRRFFYPFGITILASTIILTGINIFIEKYSNLIENGLKGLLTTNIQKEINLGEISEEKRNEIIAFLNNWKSAWENIPNDFNKYSSLYDNSFYSTMNKSNYKEWMKEKRKRYKNIKAGEIKITIEKVEIYKIDEANYSVIFKQEYLDKKRHDIGEKSMRIREFNNEWRIISEEWKSL